MQDQESVRVLGSYLMSANLSLCRYVKSQIPNDLSIQVDDITFQAHKVVYIHFSINTRKCVSLIVFKGVYIHMISLVIAILLESKNLDSSYLNSYLLFYFVFNSFL